jgi:RimJ/RimL family protein N-acetyltransferase
VQIHCQTARLSIRRFTAADEDNLVSLNGDPEVMRYICDGLMDLGYRLRRSAWGNGLATEGSRALVDRAFTDHDIERVVAETMAANLGSRRVLEKCGLTHIRTYIDDDFPALDGADPEIVEYQLTRPEWAAATTPRTP